jgi:phosphoribosylaminoimidazole carboxylase / phosphoribosylaminoimidazole-succinocarboxamide synthase
MDEKLIVEGKTKKVFETYGGNVRLEAKDDITAGDGAKHDVLKGKAEYATTTTCNVFELLKACGLPVAYSYQSSATSFVAPSCTMIPVEIVTRGEAMGSYLKRHPNIQKGHRFDPPLLEFYLKTSGRRWGKYDGLPCDDPLMEFHGDDVWLHDPAKPFIRGDFFLRISINDFGIPHAYQQILQAGEYTRQGFLVLEKAWSLLGRTLVDFKAEFGIGPKGELLWADVMDNDSWRLLDDGRHLDKQVYREDGDLDSVLENYRRVAELSADLQRVKPEVVAWFKGIINEVYTF